MPVSSIERCAAFLSGPKYKYNPINSWTPVGIGWREMPVSSLDLLDPL